MFDSASCQKIANKIAHARGFTGDKFNLVHDSGKVELKDSLNHKLVKGLSTVDTSEIVILKRSTFSEDSWSDICRAMGYEYHNHKDIESFTITNGVANISISTDTL